MFKCSIAGSSQAFINKSTHQMKNDKNQIFYLDNVSSINVLKDFFLSQAIINRTQSQPLWSMPWTRPFQTSESIFANRTMDLISFLGPLSQSSTLPSRIAKDWKVNKTIQESLICYGSYILKNKQIKDNKNQNIFINCRKLKLCKDETFDFFESIIKTQSPLLRSNTWYDKRSLIYRLNLFTKNGTFKVRILPKQMALKTNQLYENKEYWHSYFKMNQFHKKNDLEIHIDAYSLSTKVKNNFQHFNQPSSKQINPFFFFIVSKNLKNSLSQFDQMLFIQFLNLRKTEDSSKENRGVKPMQQVILKENFLLPEEKQIDIKKKLKQIWSQLGDSNTHFLAKTIQDWHIKNQALLKKIPKSFNHFQKDKKSKQTFISTRNNIKTLDNQYETPQIGKYKNFRYSREKRKSIIEFQNQSSIRYFKRKLWTEKVDFDKTKSKTQWTKKFYKHSNSNSKSKNLNYKFFSDWKGCFLKKTTFHWFQKKSQKPSIDQQNLLRLSHLFYQILSLRGRAYSSSIFTPSFQLISFDLWWALFISCGVGLVIQYQEENTPRQELRGAISLSPLSIWHLYWKQKPTHSFWPQVVNSLQLRANSWVQPRFMQFQNLFRIGISPLVVLSIKPRLINWMSFEVARVIVNVAESIENIAELVYDKVTLVSINLHTKTNSILVEQLDQAHHLSRRVGPSCDDALGVILKNPIAQLTLFLTRNLFYNVVWWTLIPLRFVGFFYSLGWRIWHIVPVSIKRYLEKRGNERRFQWTLERAINHKGMLAGAQHTLDHPGGGTFVAKRIRMINLFLRMSNICDAELSTIAGIDTRCDAGIRDILMPKSSLFIEPIGSRRDEWFQLASDHWRLPVIQLKLDWSLYKDQMSMSGKTISMKWTFGQNSIEKNVSRQGKGISSRGSAGGTSSVHSNGSTNGGPGPLFQIIREDEILDDGTIAPSMDRPQTIAEDYMVRHFMIAAATIPCLFVIEGLNIFYETEHSNSYLAVRELRERSSMGGLSYEEKMFGFLPNSGYLTLDYWDILGMPNQLEKEAEEEDYEIEELEDDPPEIRKAKLALKANLGQQDIREWVALPAEGGITGWETMELLNPDDWNPPAALLYLLWLLDKFPRTRYGIRFGVGTLLTIKEPLLRKRRWRKVYTMKGLNWVDRERIFQALMMNMGTFQLKGQMLQQVLPRSQGYTLAEMHSFVNEIALCKAQASLHLQWGKEWGWDDALFVRRRNKSHNPASASDAASNFFMWKRASYLQDLHQITPIWTRIEKALRSLMREEQASMTRLSPYYFFRDGRAHIYRHLSKWVVSAFLLPGVTRFPVYNAGEARFRYSYLERFAFGEPSYPIGYRRDPTATAAWSEMIRSLALLAGGDLYYECLENDSEQAIFKSRFFMNRIGISRQLKQMDKPIIDICWQLLWALAKQNPLVAPLTNPLHSFKKRSLKSVYKNKSYGNPILSNGVGIVQAREENTLSLYKSLPLLLFQFPGLDEEDPLGGKEPFVHTASLYPYFGWRGKKRYYDELRPITMPYPSLQVMVKDEELLHLNYVWEPLILYFFHMPRPHSFQQEEQINPEEYGRPLEVAELREVQDKKSGAALLIWSGGSPLKDAPTDLELREFITNPFPSNNNVRIFSEEPDRVWHLDGSFSKDISLDDLHFLHAWMPFFQWIYKEEKMDPICTKVWVAPYRRLHVLATYVDSYVMNDLSPIHHRLFGLDPTDSNPQKSWEIKMQELKDNRWKADNKRVDQMWINLAQNPKVAEYLRPMLKEHMEFLTMPEWIRSREHRRKIRMKERTRKLLSKTFDRANPHTGSIEDPAASAAEPLSLTAAQRAEIATSGMLMSAHECGPLWRSYHAVSTGMHRGWDLTYSTSDLRWLLFNETDRSESDLYATFYEIQKMITWLIVWIWPNLQNVFSLMQSRAVWAQEETQKSNWRLAELSYSANLEPGQTIARLETEEITAIIWNSSTSHSIIQSLPGSLPLNLFKDQLSNEINKKTGQVNPFFEISKSAEILAYKKPGWRAGELLNSF